MDLKHLQLHIIPTAAANPWLAQQLEASGIKNFSTTTKQEAPVAVDEKQTQDTVEGEEEYHDLILYDDVHLCKDLTERFQTVEREFVFSDWGVFCLSSNVPVSQCILTTNKHFVKLQPTAATTHQKELSRAFIVNTNTIALGLDDKPEAIWTEIMKHKPNIYCYIPGMVQPPAGSRTAAHVYSDTSASLDTFFRDFKVVESFDRWQLDQCKVVFSDYFRKYYRPHLRPNAQGEYCAPLASLGYDYVHMLQYMKQFSSDSIGVDVGANCGIVCLPWALHGYRTIAFEPVLENVEALQQGLMLNNVSTDVLSIEPYALSNKCQTSTIYVPLWKDNASMTPQSAVQNLPDKEYRAQVCESVTFDQWLAQHPNVAADKIRFIKIDVQGFEWPVLQGMENFLKGASNLHILYEDDVKMTRQAGFDPTAIVPFLKQLGFVESTTKFPGNVLYIKDNQLPPPPSPPTAISQPMVRRKKYRNTSEEPNLMQPHTFIRPQLDQQQESLLRSLQANPASSAQQQQRHMPAVPNTSVAQQQLNHVNSRKIRMATVPGADKAPPTQNKARYQKIR